MILTETGQIVRFHTPYEDENPDQKYVVLEIFNGSDWPRAKIQPLNTGWTFPPVNVVRPSELEVIMVSTKDLIGGIHSIIDEKGSVYKGRVVAVEQEEILPEFVLGSSGVETNVSISIRGAMGEINRGKLVIDY